MNTPSTAATPEEPDDARVPLSIVRDDAGVVTLTMQRAVQRNAMSNDSVARMLAALDTLDDCRCLVITGAGRGFCAGSDLAQLGAASVRERTHFEAACGRLARLISTAPFPVIAAVHGFAIGGGLTLAASCDIVITASDARWSLPEVAMGLFPAWGLWAVLERCGKGRARRLAWGVDTLNGDAAAALGLADDISDAPLASAHELARRLAALPRAQANAAKSFFAASRSREASDHEANRLFSASTMSPEAQATLRKYAGARTLR